VPRNGALFTSMWLPVVRSVLILKHLQNLRYPAHVQALGEVWSNRVDEVYA